VRERERERETCGEIMGDTSWEFSAAWIMSILPPSVIGFATAVYIFSAKFGCTRVR
jgi:hypothetical protein